MEIDLDDPFKGIFPCAAHPHGMDEDCEFCQAEFNAKNAIVGRLSQTAIENQQDLARQGIGPMPESMLMSIRLELLIESVLHDRNRLHFETEVARRVVQGQAEAKKQASAKKLLIPPTGTVRPLGNREHRRGRG